jgi:L-ascorbate metabolism protein UlaG (beta-lactamase superfamily)
MNISRLIQPVLKDDALLADIRIAGQDEQSAGGFRLWWLGQAGFLLQWRGRHLLFDPYLSDSLTKKYAATDKPHIRMTERAVDPARLDFLDVVTSSHNHTDHLDHETLWPLMKSNPDLTLLVPEANRVFAAERLKCDPAWFAGCDDGETIEVKGFRITGLAAAHEDVERDETGRCRFLGYIVEFGDWTVYHAGDNKGFDGMAARLLELTRSRRLDAALLPINGRKPERRVPGNFWGREAAEFAVAVNARIAIPMHYDMFTFNTETPEEFLAAAARLGQPARVLRCAERWSSDELAT